MNDYKYHIYSPSLSFGERPLFVHNSKSDRLTGFGSVYGVSKETAQAIEQAGTTKGFKGVVWSERLWLDFDSYEAAERAGSRLEEMGYDYVAFDTGGRGMHFGILRDCSPSHLIPIRDKAWATEQFPECDPRIYSHLHLFRLPGTLHHQSGKLKELIFHNATNKALILPPWEPKNVLVSVDNMDRCGDTSLFDIPSVMLNSVPAHNGHRHDQLVRLVYALKDQAGAPVQKALFWVEEVNKTFEEPKSEADIDYLIRSIYG